MSKRWYGNLTNRLEEGRNYTGRELQVGDDITMYMWSDRDCYYIDEVVSPKEIKVRRYYVCADHSKKAGMGHQNWMYFKTVDEERKYLKNFFNDAYLDEHFEEPDAETWVFRNNKWKRAFTFTEENHCTEQELKSLAKHGYYKRYSNLSGNISFGVRDYYYDWEF